MRTKSLLLASLLALQAVACGSSPGYHAGAVAPRRSPQNMAATGASPAAPPMATAQPMPPMPGDTEAPGAAKRELGFLDRKAGKADTEGRAQHKPLLVYAGTYELVAVDGVAALIEIEALAKAVGGFLAKRDDKSITIRVPVDQFSETQLRLGKLGDVTHQNVVAEDVTEEVSDVEARLKNARAMRDRMEHLLAKATTIADSIAIERELARISQEIERLDGRSKFLRDRAAYSTLTVQVTTRKVDAPVVATGPTKPQPPPPKAPKLPVPWLSQLGLPRLLSF